MSLLAINGGKPEVSERYRRFAHPLALQETDFSRFRSITVTDYNGGGVNDEFESEFAKWCGRRFALSVNSGTSALYSVYHAIGLKRGDEVLVPVYTFFATATPLVSLGCRPILVDCEPNGNIDPKSVLNLVSPKVRAIILTHMWGVPCEMEQLVSVAKETGVPLIEDASHAHGAMYSGQMVGSFGLAAAWSVGAYKLITGGQGGILATDSKGVYERAILLGHYNRRGERDITIPGYRPYATTGVGMNLRMHPFAAALALDQLRAIDAQLEHRREVAEYLTTEFQNMPGIVVPHVPTKALPSWYAFTLRLNPDELGVGRECLVEALHAEGAIEVDIPKSTCPLFRFKLFQENASLTGDFPNASSYDATVVKLPTWYGEDRLDRAAAYVQAFRKVIEYRHELK